MAKKKESSTKNEKLGWLTSAVIVAIITAVSLIVVELIKIIPDKDPLSGSSEMFEILIHVEDENNNPLAGVLVTLQPREPTPANTKYTDNLGDAIIEFEAKYEGELATISVREDKYIPFTQTVTLYKSGSPINVQIKLK